MFCPNCGAKLENDAKFCGECGNRIVDIDVDQDIEIITDEEASDDEEVVEYIEEPVKEKKKRKPKKQYTKAEKTKLGIIAAESIVFVVLLVAFILVGSSYANPSKVMKKYGEARKTGDWEKIYDLYDIQDNDFINKDCFVDDMKKKTAKEGLVVNYNNSPTTINNGITQGMVMAYSTSTGATGQTEYFTVKKDAKKRFLFFSSWSLDSSNICKENLYIKYVPGVTMKLDGIEIDSKYLSNYESNDSTVQVYKIPSVLVGDHVLSFQDKSGFIKETDQNLYVGDSEQYFVPVIKYTNSAAKKALVSAKTYVKEIYNAAYAKKGYSSIKKYFSDANIAKDAYDAVVDSYKYYTENSYSLLKYTIRVDSGEANVNAEDAGLRVTVSGNVAINYQYRGTYSGAIYKYDTNKRIYQSIVMGYDDGEWKIVSFSN
ncbi:MAG: zinc-ribbon domain-containing protein [Lachnospiraceae bacterium]|nr:zinc-ribbon domain-containing protein [Lachnospiraceae bacterium]